MSLLNYANEEGNVIELFSVPTGKYKGSPKTTEC